MVDSDTSVISLNNYTVGFSQDPKTRILSLDVTINNEPEQMQDITAKLLKVANAKVPGPWKSKIMAGYGFILYDGQAAFRITPDRKESVRKYWVTHEKGGVDRDLILDDYTEVLSNETVSEM